MFGCLSIDGIKHYRTRPDVAVGIAQSLDFEVGGIVYGRAVVSSARQQRLHYCLSGELLETSDDALGRRLGRCWPIEGAEGGIDGAVQLDDIIVHAAQGGGNRVQPGVGAVSEDTDLSLRIVAVA